MALLERAKEAVLSHTVEAGVAAITVLLAWAASIIGPAVAPAMLAVIPMPALLPLLLLSLAINLVLVVFLYLVTRKNELRLHYGIYWDKKKNPYCPGCQKPVAYGDYHLAGTGYHCNTCNHVYALQDAQGKQVLPIQAQAEL